MKPFKSLKFWLFFLAGTVLALAGAAASKTGYQAIEGYISQLNGASPESVTVSPWVAVLVFAVLALPVLLQMLLIFPAYFITARKITAPKARFEEYKSFFILSQLIAAVIMLVLIAFYIYYFYFTLDITAMYVYLMLLASLFGEAVSLVIYAAVFFALKNKAVKK